MNFVIVVLYKERGREGGRERKESRKKQANKKQTYKYGVHWYLANGQ
ncbi:MAG: hypothetical protein QXS96_04740 [Candidatus Caldarchaeum sp.]